VNFTGLPKIFFFAMSRTCLGLRLPYERALRTRESKKGENTVKYILMMSGAMAGVGTYRAWSEENRQAHMAVLTRIINELRKTGEFVATEGLEGPDQAKVVRGEKDGLPVTDGIFPESKEFLLGYWVIDVETPERAYAIAGRISAAPGPGGVPTNMPIEVRQIMTKEA
jgi:hypothetical protein